MALPVLTSNSPSAGSIAWTATTLVYDGVSYTIAAGNTALRYVWWRFSDKTVQASNTLPSLTADDFLLFLNKGGVGLIVGTTQVVDGSLIVSGSILADAIGANQITASHLAANSVTAAAIAANAVTAADIAAGAITAGKLSIGAVGDNAVKNGSFEDGVEGWGVAASGAGAVADVVTGVSSSGAYALRLVRGTAADLHVGQDQASYAPVTSVAGRSWYVACRAGAGSALASGFYLRVYWFQADKVTAASTAYTDVAANQALGTSWAVFEGTVTPPSNARYMQVRVINALSGSTMYVDEVMANEVVVAAQIGDGQITAAKIAANAVTAGSIAAGAIDGQTITGALIRTAASGQRMETASNRIRFFSPNGADAGSIQGNDNGASLGVIALATGTGQVRVGQEALPAGGSVQFSVPHAAYIDEVHTKQVVNYSTGVPLIGLTPIKPTSVSGTNVSIDGNGHVIGSSTPASAVAVNGIFDDTKFTRYLIRLSMVKPATTVNTAMRFRTASADITSNIHWVTEMVASGTMSTPTVGRLSAVGSLGNGADALGMKVDSTIEIGFIDAENVIVKAVTSGRKNAEEIKYHQSVLESSGVPATIRGFSLILGQTISFDMAVYAYA